MGDLTPTLSSLVQHSKTLQQLKKSDLHPGDWVFLKTLNSVYSVQVLSNGLYLVSGGWFDRRGLSPTKTTIRGCSWGGSVIKLDIIAAMGLCIEFGNRVVTSPVRTVLLLPGPRMS